MALLAAFTWAARCGLSGSQARLALLVPVLLLQACAGLQPGTTPEPGRAIEFVVQGRFSVQYGEEQISGLLHWRADNARDELVLSSPIGQGLARITRNPDGVTLARPGEADVVTDNVEKLTEATLGFRLPLSGLRYWIKGQADPAGAFPDEGTRRREDGTYDRLQQNGWTIDYLQYRDSHPRKIHIRRDTLQIRLVIDEWQP